MSIGFKAIQVATRSAFVDSAVRYDLRAGGVDPGQWHHLAATYDGGSRVLTLYLDGTRVADGLLNPAAQHSPAPRPAWARASFEAHQST